ncbi:bifunctional tetrahydrofolate synthase/dihydrofolate synthase [Lysobacter sp. A6]|uniref:Dihydrofolate synthase/folylpolyglutamate synthase n=1 Tax=Noviluteimonas lactosilytica TaxID=2888523 RepID=A0ABS8JFA3_9GAMM|nr:bifunctional tetrahydrofolate synthase/dihydrofolate synthase [Lysobacter lactosilyticus]MCC8362273.1 bifunctional tetrahydrofolate synthase/dihydrofolate synthase [Lysobacter lactosilyticus]
MNPPRSLEDWLAYIERQHPQDIALGLDRVRAVAERMGLVAPAERAILVAGTNGKGSTVAFLESIARAAGLRVGTYTSPHLLRYNERVRIDGHDVDDAPLVDAFEAVEQARGDTPLTYFEYGTLAALWLFEHAGLDLAVLEVGLGGRLDAVNIVDADVAVITTVDLDHQDWLGDNRETIGKEKAGIARGWKPLVLGEDDPPSSVLGHAYRIGASAIRANCDFFFDPLDNGQWRWREVNFELDLPMPALAAPVQMRNAATAIAALRALDIPMTRAAIAEGIAGAHVAGRLQRIAHERGDVVLDVGHNPQAARALAEWLEAAPVEGRTLAVYGALADKDTAGVVGALAARIDAWFLAGLPEAGPRGLAVETFAERLQGTAAAAGERHATVAEALAAALSAAKAGDRVLVFGSFHTVGEAMRALGSEGSESRRL